MAKADKQARACFTALFLCHGRQDITRVPSNGGQSIRWKARRESRAKVTACPKWAICKQPPRAPRSCSWIIAWSIRPADSRPCRPTSLPGVSKFRDRGEDHKTRASLPKAGRERLLG